MNEIKVNIGSILLTVVIAEKVYEWKKQGVDPLDRIMELAKILNELTSDVSKDYDVKLKEIIQKIKEM